MKLFCLAAIKQIVFQMPFSMYDCWKNFLDISLKEDFDKDASDD